MSDLRKKLIAAGWRQGAVLCPEFSPDRKALGFLVLTQTCDCVNPDFEKEPHLELLPLEKLTKAPDSRLTNGQNPRDIHFQIQEKGQEIWVNASIAEIFQVERKNHADLKFATDYRLPRPTLDNLIYWRAQKYVRAAFPDSFEFAFRQISKKFAKLVLPLESRIDSLLISLSPFEEIEEGDCYEIELHLMVVPDIMAHSEIISQLKETAEKLQRLFSGSPWFDSPKCAVSSLDAMTLWEARKFIDFTRYDYLSFGQNEPAPDMAVARSGNEK